jgi:hypothetical protein
MWDFLSLFPSTEGEKILQIATPVGETETHAHHRSRRSHGRRLVLFGKAGRFLNGASSVLWAPAGCLGAWAPTLRLRDSRGAQGTTVLYTPRDERERGSLLACWSCFSVELAGAMPLGCSVLRFVYQPLKTSELPAFHFPPLRAAPDRCQFIIINL